jgi:amino-acid N-acetyltransferase
LSINIRKATADDVAGIHDLLQWYSKQGRLLPRSTNDIIDHLNNFFISEKNFAFAGCVSLEIFTAELGEVRSLAVNPRFTHSGHGRVLVEQLESKAMQHGLKRLMALTYVPEFFEKLGFEITAMGNLPEKVFGVCVTCPKFKKCDELAMIKTLEYETTNVSRPVVI